jgi:hypothetical protein
MDDLENDLVNFLYEYFTRRGNEVIKDKIII